MMLQLDLAIGAYEPARRGGLDITSLRKHALKVLDRTAQEIRSSPKMSQKQSIVPEATFLFGGYSWIKKTFQMWTIAFDVEGGCFTAQPAHSIRYHLKANQFVYSASKYLNTPETTAKIAFAGDQATEGRSRLAALLNSKYSAAGHFKGLNWEPFEVIRDMLRDPKHSETIGGAPQIVKVYQYFQAAPLAVYWPSRASGKVVLQGRPCLGYERIDRWILDPNTLLSENPIYSASGERS
jgi:hypothetical protein